MSVIPEPVDPSVDPNDPPQSSEPVVTVEIVTLPDPVDSPAGIGE